MKSSETGMLSFFVLGILFFVAIFLCSGEAFAIETVEEKQQMMMSLDKDIVTFVKFAIYTGSGFLLIFASIGLCFFGWDVHKTRSQFISQRDELKIMHDEVTAKVKKIHELMEKYEELGAQIEESTDDNLRSIDNVPRGRAATFAMAGNGSAVNEKENHRGDLDIIKEVISSSSYKWTTIGRVIKKTGLNKEDILREVRSSPDLEIGFGRKTQDYLIRFKDQA
jgi:cell division protein FtsB